MMPDTNTPKSAASKAWQRCQESLDVPPDERTEDHLDQITKFSKGVQFFKYITNSQRSDLCRTMTYRSLTKNQVFIVYVCVYLVWSKPWPTHILPKTRYLCVCLCAFFYFDPFRTMICTRKPFQKAGLIHTHTHTYTYQKATHTHSSASKHVMLPPIAC